MSNEGFNGIEGLCEEFIKNESLKQGFNPSSLDSNQVMPKTF